MYKECISFDDVLIMPKYSDILSRNDISTDVDLCGLLLHIPIISANMDTVTEAKMAIAMHNAGGLGIIHRYNSIESQQLIIQECLRSIPLAYVFASVGLKDYEPRVSMLKAEGVRNI